MARKRPLWAYVLMGCGALACLCPLSVFLFAYPQARYWSAVSNCQTRIYDAGHGVLLYAQDHDGRFPNLDSWADMTTIYRKVPDSLNCPAVREYGYAMNASLVGTLAEVAKPDVTPLLFESKAQKRNAFGNPRTDSCPPRHGRRNTRVYVGGNVRFIANNYP